jgi:AcrR family transcriptional regulator
MNKQKTSARDTILDTALTLFYERGFHATSVDTILAESGISKPTLYKYFPTKDNLIQATLYKRDQHMRESLIKGMQQRGKTPREQLLALFAILAEFFQSKPFYGCMFINAAAEYAQRDHPVHQISSEHKRLFGDFILQTVEDAGVENPQDLAAQLLLIMEGAIVSAHVSDPIAAGKNAYRTAEILLTHAFDSASVE